MTLKLSVIGTGYLGATHAACMASMGFEVIGFDTEQSKIDLLSKGKVPFYEPDLEELLAKQINSGRLTFTNNINDLAGCDVHFICVGTPQVKGGIAADLTFVNSALESIAKVVKPGGLVVGKSTVPVGTAARLRNRLLELNPKADLAWNPEFSWVRADLPTSELVKVAANSFLATKISFINAMAEVCEAAGGDVTVLAKAIGYDPRIGSRFLQAGIGFGGGCLPKDIRAFMARAEELGAQQAVKFLEEIDSINLRARQRIIELVRSDLSNDLMGKKVAILGAAFKPDSDDVRDSPALDIAAQIQAAGAMVTVHDPKAITNAQKRFPALSFAEDINETLKNSNIVLHLTEWKIYREIDPSKVKALVKDAIMIDGRNALDRELWLKAGWKFRALGRSQVG